MSQFIIFMFQAAYSILANIIDDGFANKISIDSVIAYGSYIPICWTFQSVYNIGKYAYTNTQKEEKTCFLLGFYISIILLLITLPFYRYIHYIYKLTDTQIVLFNKLMLCYLFSMPLRQIGDYICTYLMYQFKNKVIIIGDILYWVTALSLDVFVYLKGLEVYWLLITTSIAYLIYDIVLIVASSILRGSVDYKFMKVAFIKGKDIVIDRVCGKVATLTYGSMATRLGSNLYAIHCVVYGIITNMEEFTNNFNIYCLARLKLCSRNVFDGAVILIRKYGLKLICLEYSISVIFLVFYHGKVDLMICIPWLLLYMTDCISLLFYESMKAVLSCYSKTEYLRYGGFVGIFIRIPFTFIMWKLGFGLVGFGLACTVDFASRGLYFYKMIRKYEKNGG